MPIITPPDIDLLDQLVPHSGLILLGFRGSVAHNTWEPPESEFSTDDVDLMGVAIGPLESYFGFESPFLGQRGVFERFVGQWDCVTYEFRKYIGLLAQCNPNVLSLLWLDDDYYLVRTPTGQKLTENRHLFLSKRIFHSFTGYARGQIHRMEHNACEGYMGEKRKSLVAKFGYDTKNAAHAIRLLRMGTECLETGHLNVYRSDRDDLLEIKHGEWTLDGIKREADTLMAMAEAAYKKSALPEEPDVPGINRLMVDIIRHYGPNRRAFNV